MTPEAIVRAAVREHGLPGAAVCAAAGDEVLLELALGTADLEGRVPVTGATLFEIASITKLFTAELVMLLVQDGMWTLDTPLTEVLPELPARWGSPRLTDVLAHQSGLPSYTDSPGYWPGAALDRGRDGILALVAGLPAADEPGDRFAYDNTGFYLLGIALERVTGRSWGSLIAERIAAPLALGSVRANVRAEVIPGRARGYTRTSDGAVENRPPYSCDNTFSAGGLLSDARDVARFGAAVQAGALLDEGLRSQMRTPRPSRARNEDALGYRLGLAWHLLRVGDRTFEGHNGNILGFASALLCDPASGLAVCVLLNADWWAAPHVLALDLLRNLAPR